MAGHCRPVIKYRRKLDRIGRVIGAEGQRAWQAHDWTSEPALDPRYIVCVHCHAKREREERQTVNEEAS